MSWTFSEFAEAVYRFRNQAMLDSMRSPTRGVCHPALRIEILRRSDAVRSYGSLPWVPWASNTLVLFGEVELIQSVLHPQNVIVLHDDKGQLGHLTITDKSINGLVTVSLLPRYRFDPDMLSTQQSGRCIPPDLEQEETQNCAPREFQVLTDLGKREQRLEEDLRRKIDDRRRTAVWRF